MSAACIDKGQLGDTGEAVVVALAGLDAAIKASDAADSQAAAKSAVTGLRSLADFVGPVAPDAQKLFGSAADALDSAGPKLPNAPTQVAQGNTDFNQALAIAQANGC